MILLVLIAGAALLMGGAELLVRGASRIAAAAAVSPLVIGLTVVAFGTSAPELAVSLGAVMSDAPAIAIGNVVGSNIFNVLFILGISALIVPLVVQRQVVRLDAPLMVTASLLLLLLALDGRIGRRDGLLLTAGMIGYATFIIRQSRHDLAGAGVERLAAGIVSSPQRAFSGLLAPSLIALTGLGLLTVGSRLFIDGAVRLARQLGVSDMIIGLTIIAAGTSLPEVATSVLASLRRECDIAVGNVIGSNIFNILGILGVCGLFARDGVAVAAAFIVFDIPIMIAVAFATLPILFTGFRISRGEGLLFLACYVAYTLFIVLKETRHDALSVFGAALLFFVLPTTVATVLFMLARSRRRRA